MTGIPEGVGRQTQSRQELERLLKSLAPAPSREETLGSDAMARQGLVEDFAGLRGPDVGGFPMEDLFRGGGPSSGDVQREAFRQGIEFADVPREGGRELDAVIKRIATEIQLEKLTRDAMAMAQLEAAQRYGEITGTDQESLQMQAFQQAIDGFVGEIRAEPVTPERYAMLQEKVGGIDVVDPEQGAMARQRLDTQRDFHARMEEMKQAISSSLEQTGAALKDPSLARSIIEGGFMSAGMQDPLTRPMAWERAQQKVLDLALGREFQTDERRSQYGMNVLDDTGKLPGQGRVRELWQRSKDKPLSFVNPRGEIEPFLEGTIERRLKEHIADEAKRILPEGVTPETTEEEVSRTAASFLGGAPTYIGLAKGALKLVPKAVGKGLEKVFGKTAAKVLMWEGAAGVSAAGVAKLAGPRESQRLEIEKLPRHLRPAAEAAATLENVLFESIAGPMMAASVPGGAWLGGKIGGKSLLGRTVAGSAGAGLGVSGGMEAATLVQRHMGTLMEQDPVFRQAIESGLVKPRGPGAIESLANAKTEQEVWDALTALGKQTLGAAAGLGPLIALSAAGQKATTPAMVQEAEAARKKAVTEVRSWAKEAAKQVEATSETSEGVKPAGGRTGAPAEGPAAPPGSEAFQGPVAPAEWLEKRVVEMVNQLAEDVGVTPEAIAEASRALEVEEAGGRAAVAEARQAERITGSEEAPTKLEEVARRAAEDEDRYEEILADQADSSGIARMELEDRYDTSLEELALEQEAAGGAAKTLKEKGVPAGRSAEETRSALQQQQAERERHQASTPDEAAARADIAHYERRAAETLSRFNAETYGGGSMMDRVIAHMHEMNAKALRDWVDGGMEGPRPRLVQYQEASADYRGVEFKREFEDEAARPRVEDRIVKEAKEPTAPRPKLKDIEAEVGTATAETAATLRSRIEGSHFAPRTKRRLLQRLDDVEAFDKEQAAWRPREDTPETPEGDPDFGRWKVADFEREADSLTDVDMLGQLADVVSGGRFADRTKKRLIDRIYRAMAELGSEGGPEVRPERMAEASEPAPPREASKVDPVAAEVSPPEVLAPTTPAPKRTLRSRLALMRQMWRDRAEKKAMAGRRKEGVPESEQPLPEQRKRSPEELRLRAKAEAEERAKAREEAPSVEEGAGVAAVGESAEMLRIRERVAKARTPGEASQIVQDLDNLSTAERQEALSLISAKMAGEEVVAARKIEDGVTRSGEAPANRSLGPDLEEVAAYNKMPREFGTTSLGAFVRHYFPPGLQKAAQIAIGRRIPKVKPESTGERADRMRERAEAIEASLATPDALFAEAVFIRESILTEQEGVRLLADEGMSKTDIEAITSHPDFGIPEMTANEAVRMWDGVLRMFEEERLVEEGNPLERLRQVKIMADEVFPRELKALADWQTGTVLSGDAATLTQRLQRLYTEHVTKTYMRSDAAGLSAIFGHGFWGNGSGLFEPVRNYLRARTARRLMEWSRQAEMAIDDPRLMSAFGSEPIGTSWRRVLGFASVTAAGTAVGMPFVASAAAGMILANPAKGMLRNLTRVMARVIKPIETPISEFSSHAMDMGQAMAASDRMTLLMLRGFERVMKHYGIEESRPLGAVTEEGYQGFDPDSPAHQLGRLLELSADPDNGIATFRDHPEWKAAPENIRGAAEELRELHEYLRKEAAMASPSYRRILDDVRRLTKTQADLREEHAAALREADQREDAARKIPDVNNLLNALVTLGKDRKKNRDAIAAAGEALGKLYEKHGLKSQWEARRRASELQGRMTGVAKQITGKQDIAQKVVDSWGMRDGFMHHITAVAHERGHRYWADAATEGRAPERVEKALTGSGPTRKRTGSLEASGLRDYDAVRATRIYLARIIPYIYMQRGFNRQHHAMFGTWRDVGKDDVRQFNRAFDTRAGDFDRASIRYAKEGVDDGVAIQGSVGRVIEHEGKLYLPEALPDEIQKLMAGSDERVANQATGRRGKKGGPRSMIALVRVLGDPNETGATRRRIQRSQEFLDRNYSPEGGNIELVSRYDLRSRVTIESGGFMREAAKARRTSLESYHNALMRPWLDVMGLDTALLGTSKYLEHSNPWSKAFAHALRYGDRGLRRIAHIVSSAKVGLGNASTAITALTGGLFLNAMEMGVTNTVTGLLWDGPRYFAALMRARGRRHGTDPLVDIRLSKAGDETSVEWASIGEAERVGSMFKDPEDQAFFSWLHRSGVMSNTRDFSFFTNHAAWKPALIVSERKLAKKLGITRKALREDMKLPVEQQQYRLTPEMITPDVIKSARYVTKKRWVGGSEKITQQSTALASFALNKTVELGFAFMTAAEGAIRVGHARRVYKEARAEGLTRVEAERKAFDSVVLLHGVFNNALRSRFFRTGGGMALGAITTWLNHAVGVYQRLPNSRKAKIWASTYVAGALANGAGLDVFEWLFGMDDEELEKGSKAEHAKGWRRDISMQIGQNLQEVPLGGELTYHALFNERISPIAWINKATGNRLFPAGLPTPTFFPTLDTVTMRGVRHLGSALKSGVVDGQHDEAMKQLKLAGRQLILPSVYNYAEQAVAPEPAGKGFTYTPTWSETKRWVPERGLARVGQILLPGHQLAESAERYSMDMQRLENEEKEGRKREVGNKVMRLLRERQELLDTGRGAEVDQRLQEIRGLAKEANVKVDKSYIDRQRKRAAIAELGFRSLSGMINAPDKVTTLERLIKWTATSQQARDREAMVKVERIMGGKRGFVSWISGEPYTGDGEGLTPRARVLFERRRAAGQRPSAREIYATVRQEVLGSR